MAKPKIDCNRCAVPGMCCRAFYLSMTFDAGSTPIEAKAQLKARAGDLPFEPIRRSEHPSVGSEEHWLFGCSALQPNGRCGVYLSRPETCRVYEAGSEPMCIHYIRAGERKPLVPMLPKERAQ